MYERGHVVAPDCHEPRVYFVRPWLVSPHTNESKEHKGANENRCEQLCRTD